MVWFWVFFFVVVVLFSFTPLKPPGRVLTVLFVSPSFFLLAVEQMLENNACPVSF